MKYDLQGNVVRHERHKASQAIAAMRHLCALVLAIWAYCACTMHDPDTSSVPLSLMAQETDGAAKAVVDSGAEGSCVMTYDGIKDDALSPVKNGKTGWSVGGNLTARQPTVATVQMQADFERDLGGDGAGTYTVQFAIGSLPAAANVKAQAQAFITWSVNGQSVQRRVSVANGTSVTGVGESVKVVIVDTTNQVNPPWVLPLKFTAQYRVSALVVKGTRPSVQQPPVLLPEDTVQFAGGPGWEQGQAFLNGGGDFIDAPVTPDMGVISVFVTGAKTAVGATQVLVLGENSTVLKVYDPVVYPGWVPIPGAAVVRITNVTAIAQVVSIALGIDG